MSDQPDYLPDEDLPPPYSLRAGSSYSPRAGSSISPQSSLFSSHLASIRCQITAEQAARTSARDQRDSYVLSLLVPHVEHLLSSIAGIHPPPSLVEATMVPDGAIGKGWQFSDEHEKRQGEAWKLIQVRQDSKMDSDGKLADFQGVKGLDDRSASQSEPNLWWADEAMARRLARHLQPERATASNDGQTVPGRDGAEPKEGKKPSRWSLFKRDEASVQPNPPPRKPTPSASGSTAHQPGDGVTMSVRAEEVTFRKENDLGIWETSTGWGIVIRVRIRHA